MDGIKRNCLSILTTKKGTYMTENDSLRNKQNEAQATKILNTNRLKDSKKIAEIEELRDGSNVSFEKYASKLEELKERDPTLDIVNISKEELIRIKRDLATGGRRRKIIKELLGLDNKIFEGVKATYLFIHED